MRSCPLHLTTRARFTAETNKQPTLARMADAEVPVSLVLRHVPWRCGKKAGSLQREAAQSQCREDKKENSGEKVIVPGELN